MINEPRGQRRGRMNLDAAADRPHALAPSQGFDPVVAFADIGASLLEVFNAGAQDCPCAWPRPSPAQARRARA
eukprot:2409959-Pyramimonas_sp.AAC.1